jgi:hypothetical protein
MERTSGATRTQSNVDVSYLGMTDISGGGIGRSRIAPAHAFFTNSDLRLMAPMPSILQSMS